MQDFQIQPFDFSATQATIVASSEKGKTEFARRYGDSCISINVRKSALPEVSLKIQAAGFSIN